MFNDISNELSINFIEYAVAVNTDRALPDVYSGLKPVVKRILWAAYEKGYISSKPHVKSTRIVGDTMALFHPHGDSSIYGAMVRLSQPWVLRYPLIDWHGSNGNIAGDGPAAARYTESRLSKLAEEGMLCGIKKKNVDFIPNYDETLEEPVTLPSLFPNLLCNPNEGIGVAMACKWAPHNLKEVAQAVYDYMDNKEPMLPGPDFPTGGIVINKNDIPAIMRTGHGSVKIRGRYKVEKNKIIFYEIPYGQTIEGIISEIGELCESKELDGIVDAHDESNKKGIRIVITCDKNINPESIVLKIFAKTSLQSSFAYNQVALVDKTPTELNLKQAIYYYVEHNVNCILREVTYDMEKTKKRIHIIEGLLKAIDIIDEIIAMIKASPSAAAARGTLQEKWKFTEDQAKAILDMKLSRLAKLEKDELTQEKKDLEELYKKLLEIFENPKKELRSRLETLVKKYGDDRRTELTQIEVPKEEKEIIEVVPEDVVVITTQSGLIKRVPVASYKVQRKGGKGIKSTDDTIMSTIKTNTVDYMMFFTDKGKMYRTVVDNIPTGTNITKGTPINNLVKLDNNEKVIAVTSLHRKTTPKFVIFITKEGMIKKTFLEEYLGAKKNAGIQAIKLREGDTAASILFQDEEDIIVVTKKGMNIRFATKDIGAIGRLAIGVKAINLNEDDEVVAALPVHKDTDSLGIFISNGMGKRISLKEISTQNRGGKGTYLYKPQSDEYIIGAAMLDDSDNVLISGNKSSICISVTEIPLIGRTALGNILIKDNRVLGITKI